MRREGVLAVALTLSAAVLGWQWWPGGGAAPYVPPGTPFPILPNDTSVIPLEPFADIAMQAVPPVPVPLPEPMELDTAFGLAASAFPEPTRALPQAPPVQPRCAAPATHAAMDAVELARLEMCRPRQR